MQMKQNLLQIQRNHQKVQYQIHWRLEQDAVYWIHLTTAEDAGLEFWQTDSDANITCQLVPRDCVVKVVSEVEKDHCSRDSSHFENDQK